MMTHILVACAAALTSTAALPAAQSGSGTAPLNYTLVENWGPLPGGRAWGEVTGVIT